MFYAHHGNQRYCSKACPKRRKRWGDGGPGRLVFPPRSCDYCGTTFRPKVANQRFCRRACQSLGRRPEERLLYHNTQHRGLRLRWAPIVAEGGVLCLGPNGCGQPIHPGERWDLGHLPNGARTPQHARCNRKTGGRRSAGTGRIW